MNLTIKTFEQVHIALEAVENERTNIFLKDDELLALETAAIQLRNIERALIKTQETELVQALQSDSAALKELVAEIKSSADKLQNISEVLEKASKGVEALVKILITASAAGIL